MAVKSIFNTEFNISFGYTCSYICDTCECQQVEIKAVELDNNVAEIRLKTTNELHLRKAEVFKVQLQEVTKQAKTM